MFPKKGKTDKCHLIIIKNNAQEVQVGESLIKRNNCEKLLGINIDYKLTFDNHVNNLSKKANNKLRVLVRATPHMNIEEEKLLMHNLIIVSLYGCCIVITIMIKSNIYTRDI